MFRSLTNCKLKLTEDCKDALVRALFVKIFCIAHIVSTVAGSIDKGFVHLWKFALRVERILL